MAGYVWLQHLSNLKSIRDCLLTHCGGFIWYAFHNGGNKKAVSPPAANVLMRFLESKPKQALWTQKRQNSWPHALLSGPRENGVLLLQRLDS